MNAGGKHGISLLGSDAVRERQETIRMSCYLSRALTTSAASFFFPTLCNQLPSAYYTDIH